MHILDKIFKFPNTKDVQDISKSDFIYHNGQYIINCKPKWSTQPFGMAVDAEDWEDFDEDLIRRILQDKMNKNREADFNYIKTGVRESKFLKESFSDFCRVKNIL
jgi:hypothetical protein